MLKNGNRTQQPTTNTSALIPSLEEKFFNRLQDRLHAITERTMEIGEENEHFTIFLNVLDNRQTDNNNRIIFAGLEAQERILETRKSNNKCKEEDYELSPEFLSLKNFDATVDDLKSGKDCIDKFFSQTLSISDLKAKRLIHYFPEKKSDYLPLQKIESDIFQKYSILESRYYYLPIPLIAFAKIVGVIQIVAEDNKNIQAEFNKKLLIKLFSIAYENLRLDWDIVGNNIKKPSLIQLNNLIVLSKKNKFLTDLKFHKYYKNAQRHLTEKRRNVNDIPLTIIEQYRRNGVMATLLDSYSHNMSAHSLTGLGWIFKEREQRLNKAKKEGITPSNKSLIDSSIYLSREAYALTKHLAEKGTFWSRAMQPFSFGGSISSFYSILWKDFLQNPLFLGTIAHSEGIHRINLKIIVYNKVETYGEEVKRKRRIKRNEKGELLCGELGSVDLDKVNQKAEKDSDISYFSFEGKEHKKLAKFLKKTKVFLPGGVVGKHAFYTIIENEIRNVKHYNHDGIREDMQENGLTICLSLEELTYRNKDKYHGSNLGKKQKELWKIGIWINHLTTIDNELAQKRLDTIGKDIIDIDNGEGSFEPHLGGSFQDKICAALLFNGTFTSVERKTFLRDQVYYPWIKAGCSELHDCTKETVDDWEFSYRRLKGDYPKSKKYFEDNFQTIKQGYLKKFIQLWQGEEVLNIGNSLMGYDIQNKWENPSRFFIINISNANKAKQTDIKKSGVVRIISHSSENLNLEEAYIHWFKIWFKDIPKCFIWLNTKENSRSAEIEFDGNRIIYRNASLASKLMTIAVQKLNFQNYKLFKVPLAHGGKDYDHRTNRNVCRYRSHGVLNYYFTKNQPIHLAKVRTRKAAELLETILTKICIYDNRIAERTNKMLNLKILKEKLFCSFHSENKDMWIKERDDNKFLKYHFLVIHLSFIESMEKTYSEKNINTFIEEEILRGEEVPENFRLVITTGRGRMAWWTNLHEEYKSFVTFKPIDMLTSAVEHAVSMDDDFELKYRLVKVLFGS